MAKRNPSIFSKAMVHLFFAFVRLLAFLPFSWLQAIGRGMGWLLYVSGYRRTVVEANLRYCFPELSFDQRQAMLRSHFRYVGEGLLELPAAWHKSFDSLEKHHEIRGLEHYEQAKASGQGIVFLGYHTTSIELVGALMSKYLDYAAFYRVNDHPTIEYHIQKGRDNRTTSIKKNDLRFVKRWLKDGGGLWLNSDRDMGPKRSVFSTFFDKPIATVTSPFRFAKLGNAKVLPLSYHKDSQGTLIIEVLPEVTYTGDQAIDCLMTNKILEAVIMQAPEQYYWVHRRFKTLPEGQRQIYRAKVPKLRQISQKEHQGAIDSGTVINEIHGKPSRVKTADGQILQITKRHSSLPFDQTQKVLEHFMRSCLQLAFRGFYSISPQEFTYCKAERSFMIRYKDFDSLPINHIPKSKSESIAKLLARWFAQLHAEGVIVNPSKSSNIQLMNQGHFAILDPTDCIFFNEIPGEKLRTDDIDALCELVDLLAEPNSQALFKQYYATCFSEFSEPQHS